MDGQMTAYNSCGQSEKNKTANQSSAEQLSSSSDEQKRDRIRRRIPKCDGVYVEGAIEGVDVIFTADTGATKTIISDRIYNRIPAAKRPKLKASRRFSGAGGAPLVELGKAKFRFQLQSLQIESEVVVAEIEDEALLGIDILQNGRGGPADLLLSKGIIMLRETAIPCIQIGLPTEPRERRVRAADHYVIPPNSENIVDVFIDREEQDDYLSTLDVLVEPTAHFNEEYPLVMAASLVDMKNNTTGKVRIMNPYSTEVSIRQDAVIGHAEAVHSDVSLVMEAENIEEAENNNAVRRINFQAPADNIAEIRTVTNQGPDSKHDDIPPLPEYLRDLYENAAKNHNKEECHAIARLLNKYKGSFSKDDTDLGLTTWVEHGIDTGDSRPLKQPPRRVPMAFAGEEKKVITQLEEQKVIRKSNSPWASPIVLVKKKNGKTRPCVDYRRLNSVTTKDAFPLPRVQDCLDAVAGATLFSTFDFTSGYHQIPVRKEDIPKTAFVTKYGLYEYTTMPMGLTNAPATFQRVMEIALNGLQWQTCLIYLDDIVVFGRTFEEHLQRVEQVLERVQQAGLKLKPEKCQLLQTEVNFLGHVISEDGIKPNPANIAKIVQWPVPTTVTQVRQILGMGSYYRRFVKDFAKLTRPLVELTRKGQEFKWTAACQTSFETLKEILAGPDVMAYPQAEGEFVLDTDASDVGLGGVLSQIQDGVERVIAYGSRALNHAEKNYCVTDKELLALRYFVEYFRQYLLGRRFRVRTDHQALVWLFTLREPKGRIARWIEILSSYDFSVEYRMGKKHLNADAMSRCPNPRDCQCSAVDNLEPLRCGPCKKCCKRNQDMAHQITVTTNATQDATESEETSLKQVNADNQAETPESVDTDRQEQSSLPLPTRAVKTRARAREEMPETVNMPSTSTAQTSQPQTRQSETSQVNGCTTSMLRRKQEEDKDISPILTAMRQGVRPLSAEIATQSPVTRHYWNLWESLELRDGILHKKFYRKNGTGEHVQFLVPHSLRKDVMYQMHNTLLAGHLGRKKTTEKTLQRYY
jgi:hypothetical protein